MTDSNSTYRLLDSGGFQKLEQVGPYRLVRPSLQAIWEPTLPQSEWEAAHARFVRFSGGDGEWKVHKKIKKDQWSVMLEEITFIMDMTDFGHLGLFAEQADNWRWFQEQVGKWTAQDKPVRVLNLFAYTGGSTLACARAGAQVVHVDASKTSVSWARKNAEASLLSDKPIRWIVEDVQKFVQRELRRGNTYHGIILDPPSYGRGPKNEIWKLEESLSLFMDDLAKLFDQEYGFVLLSAHSPGLTPLGLENVLRQHFGEREGQFSSREMVIRAQQNHCSLPSGAQALFCQE